jgi:hypothetical protein
MSNPSDDHSEFDFYISANRENAAAREVDQVLREAGYSVYFPGRNNEEAEADRIAANHSKAIIVILTKDSGQTQIDLDELLNILSIGDAERCVIILQFEECQIASLLDRNFITNLVGLNSHDRALRILESAGQGPQRRTGAAPKRAVPTARAPSFGPAAPAAAGAPAPAKPSGVVLRTLTDEERSARAHALADARLREAEERKIAEEKALRLPRPIPSGARVQSDESHTDTDWESNLQEIAASSANTEAELRPSGASADWRRHWRHRPPVFAPPMPAPPDVDLFPPFHEDAHTTRELTTDSHKEREEALRIRQETAEEKDIVEFGVSHPASVTIGVAFIVDVLIYRQNDRERVAELAAELRAENDRFGFAGANEVVRGTKLNVTLELPWPTEPKIQSVYWSGLTANISFRVSPTNLPHAPIYGVCKIAVNGLTIGQVFFRLEASPSGVADERKFSAARAIKTAFASYTSKDRRRVLARVQGIEKLGVKVFMDTHGLRSNEQYKKRIFEAIDSSDILYLFWSSHARHSNWVDQEWRYGFRQKGLGFIDPVPLVDPRKAPPPAELAEHKHFNDWTLIYSEYEKSLSTWARIRSWLAD